MNLAYFERRASEVAPNLHQNLRDRDIIELENLTSEQLANIFRSSDTFCLSTDLNEQGNLYSTELLEVLVWVGSRCPSLALMMVMHHHTVAGFNLLAATQPVLSSYLTQIKCKHLLVASAFAEGESSSKILDHHVYADKVRSGYIVNGTKKPCTMANVMDMMLLGIRIRGQSGTDQIGTAIISAKSDKIERRRFWEADILKSSDTHELMFNDLFIPEFKVSISENISFCLNNEGIKVEDILLTWFQFLACSAYYGVTLALVEKLKSKKPKIINDYTQIASKLELATLGLKSMAQILESRDISANDFARCSLLRVGIEETILYCSQTANHLLGGISAIKDKEANYLFNVSRFLSFHPPSKDRINSVVCNSEL